MDMIANVAECFMGLFVAGGQQLTSWITGIIPKVICLMTAVNAVIALIGEERVETFCSKITGNFLCRYLLLPLVALFCLASPMCFSCGRFVEEKYKAAYYDATVSFVHPITGLFPHANAGELFVYMGIADGISKLGYSTTPLAIRYFIVGLIVMLLRGLITERIYAILTKEQNVVA